MDNEVGSERRGRPRHLRKTNSDAANLVRACVQPEPEPKLELALEPELVPEPDLEPEPKLELALEIVPPEHPGHECRSLGNDPRIRYSILMSVRVLLLSFVMLVGCGARSDLTVNAEDDAGRAPGLRTELFGAWWFNTIRALCDSLAIEFCGGDVVAVRYSFDDSCVGDNPSTTEPVAGTVTFLSATRFRIDLDPSVVTHREGSTRAQLEFDFVPGESGDGSDDTLRWVDLPDTAWPAWTDGVREETVTPVPRARVFENFVFCP